MSYEYRTKPPEKDGSFAASLWPLEAELDENVVRCSKIGPALERIGKQLMKQYKGYKTRDGNKDIIGIRFNMLTFNFILDPKKKSKV